MAENYKRLTLFAGHYGSGKTNLAVNYALALRRSGKKVRIADLDIVNPYFRTKDSAEELAAAGVELVSPTYANTNLDIPALPQEMYGLFERRDSYAVIDVGGDDAGAYALGRFAPLILEENDYEMIFTVNFYRPLTLDAESALEVMREIEAACGIPFTAIADNSNLGDETLPEDVEATAEQARRLSELSGLPVIMTAAREDICGDIKAEDLFPLTLQKKYF